MLKNWIARACTELGQELVGHCIKVWWPGEQEYFRGFVTSFDSASCEHHVQYEPDPGQHDGAGHAEDLWLAVESYQDLGKCASSIKRLITHDLCNCKQ